MHAIFSNYYGFEFRLGCIEKIITIRNFTDSILFSSILNIPLFIFLLNAKKSTATKTHGDPPNY